MDNSSSKLQQDNLNIPLQKKKTVSIFLIEFIILIIVIFLMFVALNYFKILPFSSLFPSQKSQPISTVEKNNLPLTRLKINCPTTKEACNKGSDVFKDRIYIGLGYKLSTGSAIFAAFDGDITTTLGTFLSTKGTVTEEKKFYTIHLNNNDLGLWATYFLRGRVTTEKKVGKGQQIATVSGGKISIYDDSSLVFSLTQDTTTNNPIFLNKDQFE